MSGIWKDKTFELKTAFGDQEVPTPLLKSVTMRSDSVKEGLILYFTFDAEDSDVIHDKSGKGNNGVLCGAKYIQDGKVGGGIRVGRRMGYIQVPDNELWSFGMKPFTICLWLKLDALPYNEHDFINYKIVGDGPVSIVLIHGFGASLQNWNDILPYFDHSEFKIVLVDLKGSGFSSKPVNSDYSMVEKSRIIGNFLKYINISNYYLAGHSSGGGIVLLISINLLDENTYPLPNGLILLDAAVYKTELPFFVNISVSQL